MSGFAYSELRWLLRTGDMVLCSGRGFTSWGIKLFTGSKYSHVGLIARFPNEDYITIFESTTLSKLKDLQTGKAVQGVQTVPFSERLRTYDGEIYIRQLLYQGRRVTVEQEQQLSQGLMRIRRELSGRPYETNRLELVAAAFGGIPWRRRPDLSSIFCSELLVESEQRLELMSRKLPSNCYDPEDLGDNKKLAEIMLHPWSYNPAFRVHYDAPSESRSGGS